MRCAPLVLCVLLYGCGDDDGSSADGPSGGDGPGVADGPPAGDTGVADSPVTADAGPFGLTSSAISEGEMFPDEHTCDDADTSPPLAWTGAPSGTQSFAIVLRDLDYMSGFVHWVIWDIPASTTSLPEDVENVYAPATPAGAHQCRSYDGTTYGYRGPCSPSTVNTYEFTLYALDVATVPGLDMNSSRAEAVTAILEHDIASTTLSGEH
jgi:hypothetical protein